MEDATHRPLLAWSLRPCRHTPHDGSVPRPLRRIAWSLKTLQRFWFATLIVLLLAPSGNARAQLISARRLAMGSVILTGGGRGNSGRNVAYRAVPAAPATETAFSLPIGLIPFLADLPVFDPKDPGFNVYALTNLLYNPPWNLPLVEPKTPSSDITIAVSKNSLSADLGDIAAIFPKDHSRIAAVTEAPAIAIGVKRIFFGVAPLVEYDNDLHLNDALHGALAEGAAFTPRTEYALFDKARGQVAAGAQIGWAAPVMQRGDPRGDGAGLYAGVRFKLLRGIAYGDADNVAAFTTRDTLFGTDPVDVSYTGRMRTAGPSDGGLGEGFDLGLVWLAGGLELGVGADNVATRIHWRVREKLAYSDSATGDYVDSTLSEGTAFTSRVPTTVTVSAEKRIGRVLVAADVLTGLHQAQAHLGAELWTGRVAWRAGLSNDANREIQYAGGIGLRMGGVGLDVAVASQSRNLSRERALDLGAGLAFYHGQHP